MIYKKQRNLATKHSLTRQCPPTICIYLSVHLSVYLSVSLGAYIAQKRGTLLPVVFVSTTLKQIELKDLSCSGFEADLQNFKIKTTGAFWLSLIKSYVHKSRKLGALFLYWLLTGFTNKLCCPSECVQANCNYSEAHL